MQWSGWRSWFSVAPMPEIPSFSAFGGRAAEPWVPTDSGQLPPRQLTAGSDLDRTAEGPWRPIIDAGLLDYKGGSAAWRPSTLQTVKSVKLPANYGEVTSLTNFSFKNAAFPADEVGMPSIGLLPGPIPNPHRPMWNNLPGTNVYHMRVANPTKTRLTELRNTNANKYAMSGNPYAGSASLNTSGTFQSEVLL